MYSDQIMNRSTQTGDKLKKKFANENHNKCKCANLVVEQHLTKTLSIVFSF